jgi:hypothetical protein
MYINGLELSLIPTSMRRCQIHATKYEECGSLHPNHQLIGPCTRTPYQLASWRETAITLIQQYLYNLEVFSDLDNIGAARQEGRFNGSCQYCEYQKICRQDRSIFAVETHLTNRPWRSLLEGKLSPFGRKEEAA